MTRSAMFVALPDSRFTCPGSISFVAARTLQAELLQRAIAEDQEQILLCEHPPTLSIGPRTNAQDLGIPIETWSARGYTIEHTDRGGGPTLHLPGQLLIYPVISLRKRNWGVRRFVQELATAVVAAIADSQCHYDCKQVGIWKGEGTEARKLAAIGLRIVQGVSMHGLSLNVSCDTTPFSWFSPCGLDGTRVTSMVEQGLATGPEFEQRLIANLTERLF